ncbi:MAG: hypothetical protein GPJ54_04695 [Candidatus Heimdallarchaeota archaeon]|nr:hypothetical protein [Candidatus Heimdallarchaeota archaeon]
MAVREQQLNTTAQGFTVDLSFMSKSKLKSALSKLGNLLTLGRLRGNNEYDPSKFDAEKAREAQMANYNNIANMAHLYSRRF